MGAVDGNGRLAPLLDDSIRAMIYSMLGENTPEGQLRFQLDLAHNSLRDMHVQIEALQHKCHSLEYKYVKAKEEASLNAVALRRKIGEYEVLKEKYEQLMKECELYHNDREIFSEAAEDAEERRAEAERQAAEAEKRAVEAEQREKAAMRFVEDVLRASPKESPHHHAPPAEDLRDRPATNVADGLSLCFSRSESFSEECTEQPCQPSRGLPTTATTTSQAGPSENTAGRTQTSGQRARRILFEATSNVSEDNTTLPRKRSGKGALLERSLSMDENCKRSGKGASLERSLSMGDNCKNQAAYTQAGRSHPVSPLEKENIFNFTEIDGEGGIGQAAQSDVSILKLLVRHLSRLIRVANKNLLKAEQEGDLIQAKYCELHRLLMDTLVTFDILPELCTAKVAQSPSQLCRNTDSTSPSSIGQT